MSSILKALKKLESEQTEQEKVQSLSRAVHLKKGKTSPVQDYWRIPKFTVLMLVLLLMVGIGVIAWKYNERDHHEPHVASVLDKVPPRSPISETGKMLSEKERRSLPDPNLDVNPVLQPSSLTPQDLGKMTPEKSMPMVDPVSSDKQKSPLPGKEQGKISKPTVLSSETPHVKPEANKNGSLDRLDRETNTGDEDIAPLENPDLKLMAIAWSDDPKSRIAVINDRIVREGDILQGMTISRINEDEVILRKQGRNWKLEFRLQ